MENKIADSTFTKLALIGKGSFGTIFLALSQNHELGAAKFEDKKSRVMQLSHEAKILQRLQGAIGIPRLLWNGHDEKNNIMIMELLGPNLEDLFAMCHRRFSLKTVLMLGEQMITRLEYLHSKNYIHRDLKPENFVVGCGKRSTLIHLIDYGLAKRYRDPKTRAHISYNESKSLTGTARYASVNAHLGIEQSRRDDLEALGYILVYFLRGSLPWQGYKAETKQEKYHKIMEKKMQTPPGLLCKALPLEFSTYLEYCRALGFEDKPDYSYLRNLMKESFVMHGYQWDMMYDWCLPIHENRNEFYQTRYLSIQAHITDQYHAEITAPQPIVFARNKLAEDFEEKRKRTFNSLVQQQRSLGSNAISPNQPSSRQHISKKSCPSNNSIVFDQEIKQIPEMSQSIYERIGGAAAVQIAVERLYASLTKDPRVAHFFKNTDIKRQAQRQKEFMTTVLGGPSIYTGRNMRDAHLNMGLKDEHFDVVVQTFASILMDLGVDQSIIGEVADLCETLRIDVLGR